MAGRARAAAMLVAALVCHAAPTDLQQQTPHGAVNARSPFYLKTYHVRRNTALNFTSPSWDEEGSIRKQRLMNEETTPRITPFKINELNNLSNFTQHQETSRPHKLGNFSQHPLAIFKNLMTSMKYKNNTINLHNNAILNEPQTRNQRYGPNKVTENVAKFKAKSSNNYGSVNKTQYDNNNASYKYIDMNVSNMNYGSRLKEEIETRGYGPNEISNSGLNLRNFDKFSDLLLKTNVINKKSNSEITMERMKRDLQRNNPDSSYENTSTHDIEAHRYDTVSTVSIIMDKRIDKSFANMLRINITSNNNTNTMRGGKVDAPMLNYIFDTYSTMNKHKHQNDRFGSPQFEGSTESVVADTSATAYLDCRVASLQDKLVVWVRRKPGEDGLDLLTTGLQTYTADTRYSASLVAPDNWRLKITDAAPSDSGLYECQISTHPPMTQTTRLRVHAPVVRIVDGAPKSTPPTLVPEAPTGVPVVGHAFTKRINTYPPFTKTTNFFALASTRASVSETTVPEVAPLADVHYEAKSCLSLSCMVRHMAMEGRVVDWYHEERHLNYDMDRGGISVRTTVGPWGADSALSVARLTRADSGNYTCSVATATDTHNTHATVLVHVLNGESLAELHQGSSCLSEASYQATLFSLVISFIIFLF